MGGSPDNNISVGGLFAALLSDIITYIFVAIMAVLACCFLRKPERRNEGELLGSQRHLYRHSQYMTSLQRTNNQQINQQQPAEVPT
jgi:hypothetical protein